MTEAFEAERQRLEALRKTELLDTPAEEIFDRITRLASSALATPVALISLVDVDRQFFKSQMGLPTPYAERRETPLSHSFCQHVAKSGTPLIVSDAREHELVSQNLAIRDLNVIAYAGVPLLDLEGNCLGSLCAIDSRPRHWTNLDVELLKSLAAQAMTEIALRSRTRYIAEMQQRDVARKINTRHTIHDLRTPLNSLLMSLDVLTLVAPLDPAHIEWVESAKSSGLALKLLTDDLIDNEAIEQKGRGALTIGPTDLNKTIDEALDQTRGSAHSKHIVLRSQRSGEIPIIVADGPKLVRVFVNLIGNAIKFTPEKGSVVVSVSRRGHSQIALSVVDTGIGFSDDKIGQIFEKGITLQADADTKISTGWGLEFCKRTIEAHGGSIEVSSSLNQGSTFTVVLPITHLSRPLLQ